MDEYRKYEPIFGSWKLERLIGKGSFGKVFEISREEYGTTYRAALKIISVPQDDDDVKSRMAGGTDIENISEYYESILKEIVNENEIMSKLKGNSNIVSYEDHMIVPHEDGFGWDIMIRMELLTPLLRYCDGNELTPEAVLKMGIDLCKALELCANHDIIHRDIKPDNIFVSPNGDFKLGDFGVSRVLEETRIGLSLRGTYTYMAPEVYKGEAYGPRTDIYSLGLVLYKFLNGGRNVFLPAPGESFTQEDEDRAFFRRMSGAAAEPPANGSDALRCIVLKACAYRPADRFSSAQEMRQALEELDYRRKYDDAKATAPVVEAAAQEAPVVDATEEEAPMEETLVEEVVPEAAAEVAETAAAVAGTADEAAAAEAPVEVEPAPEKPEEVSEPSVPVKKRLSKKVVAAFALAAAAVVALVIYAAIPKEVTDVTGIGTAEELYIGDTMKVKYDIEPDRFEDEPMSFKSSDEKVLTVNKAGALTGVSVGEATMTLKVKEFTKSVNVKVVPKVTEISGVDSDISIYRGDTHELKPELAPEKFSKEPISYSTSDDDVADVSKEGIITAAGNGTADITIHAGGCTKKVEVTVTERPTSPPVVYNSGSSGGKSSGSSKKSKKKSGSDKGSFSSGDDEYF